MIKKIQLALSKEELEELCISEETVGESLAALRMTLSMIETLCILSGQNVLVTRWFEDGEGKRWKPYVKGFSYVTLERIENKITDFLYDGKVYRLYLITRVGEKEAVPVTTPYYIRTLENVVLKNPRLPKEYFNNKEDAEVNFSSSSLLNSIELSDCEMGNHVNLYGMFCMCKGVKHIELAGINTSNIREMQLMFSQCSSLKTLDLSNLDTRKANDISFMFEGCSSLTSLDLSGWNLSKAKFSIGIFAGCTSLKTIYMIGCDAYTIAQITTALKDEKISEKIIKTTK